MDGRDGGGDVRWGILFGGGAVVFQVVRGGGGGGGIGEIKGNVIGGWVLRLGGGGGGGGVRRGMDKVLAYDYDFGADAMVGGGGGFAG